MHRQRFQPVTRWQVWETTILLLPLSADVYNVSVAVARHCIKGSSRADLACIPSEGSQGALQEGGSLQCTGRNPVMQRRLQVLVRFVPGRFGCLHSCPQI